MSVSLNCLAVCLTQKKYHSEMMSLLQLTDTRILRIALNEELDQQDGSKDVIHVLKCISD